MQRPIVFVLAVAACSGDGATNLPVDARDAGASAEDGGAVSSCDPPGRFGVPETMFMLPPTNTGFYYPDIQAAFPEVDWQTLDRLYLPAGRYTHIQIGNLPVRDPARPLVITNHGGQFVIADNPDGNYIWSFGGGANWILTGRYDSESQTGHEDFPGHACGAYADSAGRYGILSDDGFAFDAPYLHMGISVGGGATDFEIEYVEVTRSGFAGIRLLNHPNEGTDKPMENVRVHDTYIHDVDGEGFYFGWTGTPPSNKFVNLQVYNNRILRTGNEALQLQDLADGARIYNNTLVSGGLRWLDNPLGRYQDNLVQLSVREGTIELDHNVFIDAASNIIILFTSPQNGDGDRFVQFHDNYVSDTINRALYLNGTSTAPSELKFERNVFRGLEFGYTPADPSATDPNVVVGRNGGVMRPVVFANNHWTGTERIIAGISGGDGSAGNVTLTGNVHDDAGAIELVDGPWTTSGHHLTTWAPNATVASGGPAVTYHAGDIVMHGATPTMYRCTAESTGESPDEAPAAWTPLPRPSDDVRVVPGTQYAGYGVQ